MHIERSRFLFSALLLYACAGIFPGSARGAAHDYSDSPSVLVGFNPGHFVVDAHGTWATGNATLRFHADGTLAYQAPLFLRGGDALLAETSDGGLLQADIPIAGTPQAVPCSLSALNQYDAVRWTEQVSASDYCTALIVDSNDTIWVLAQSYGGGGAELFLLGADGSGLTQVAFPAGFVAFSAPVAATGGGVYLAGYVAVAGSAASSSVVRLDANGSVVWQWKGQADDITLAALGLDAAGNVQAAGAFSSASNPKLAEISLTANGVLRWTKTFDAPGLLLTGGFATTAEGAAYAFERPLSGGASTLQKIDASGNLAWQRELPLQAAANSFNSLVDGHAGLRVAPNGDVVALADNGGYGVITSQTKLFRYDPDGNLIATSAITAQPNANRVGVSAMQTLPDSSVLLSTVSGFEAPDGAGVVNPGSVNGLFLHLDRSGQALANPVGGADVVDNGVVLDSIVDADGTTYLLTQHRLGQFNDAPNDILGASTARYALSRISPDGTRAWKSYWDGYWYGARLSEGADRICIGGSLGAYALTVFFGSSLPPGSTPDTRVQCHAIATGAKLWTYQLQAPGNTLGGDKIFLRTRADASTVAAFRDASGDIRLVTIDAAGNATQTHETPAAGFIYGMAADGSVLLVDATAGPAIRVVQNDGTVGYTQTLTALPNIRAAQYFDDRSSEFIGSSSDGSLTVAALSATGAALWTTRLADAATAAGIHQFGGTDDGSDSFFAFGDGTTTRLSRLDRASGAIRWQTTISPAGNSFGLAVDAATAQVVLYTLYDHRLGLQLIDRASGARGALTYRDCSSVNCGAVAAQLAAIGTDGTLRIVLSGATPDQPPQIIAVGDATKTAAPIVAAQPGIAGAWFAPYESGQGFVIDYFADVGVMFIPWFTYTQSGGNEPAALAWYTLQGSAAPGASRVELDIGSNDGGKFQSGTTAAHRVGGAHIGFSDCDHGTLSYQFNSDVNGGASGSLNIVRLGPSTVPCTLANGSVVAAENPSPPFNGFDAKQSGSWFDPATSGQGIEFSVIPAADNFPGFLYGAWFTFDPAGAADDPTQQHWFTLQGDLGSASNGQVTVPIVATLGGSFDATPTSNSFQVGHATVTFLSCSTAKVDYQFDSSRVAHAYRNMSGSMNLQRIDGCLK